MPTRSELPIREWTARVTGARHSIYPNYGPGDSVQPGAAAAPGVEASAPHAVPSFDGEGSQAASLALARSFVYRLLARAYEDPGESGWVWLGESSTQAGMQSACTLAMPSISATGTTGRVAPRWPDFQPETFESFRAEYVATFGHAARGRCPLNEIEYGDLKADPLFQPHRLADLAAFYRAFGLEVCEDADERPDHLCFELEFMTVLTAKEAYALDRRLAGDEWAICRDAQRQFLREHLGRWMPAFCRRLQATTTEPTLKALADFTRAFIETECARHGVAPGSEDLLLRPVDEAAESQCASCGMGAPSPA